MRAFWLVMLGGHAKATLAAWISLVSGDAADPARVVGLSLAIGFFALKVIDVAWLRFRTDRRSLVALSLIVALLHAESLGFASTGEFAPQLLATVSAAMLLEPVQRRWGRLREALFAESADSAIVHGPRLSQVDLLSIFTAKRPQWVLIRSASPPRAPPF
jgi:hypothetical protein